MNSRLAGRATSCDLAYKKMRGLGSEVNKRRGEPSAAPTFPLTNYRGIELARFSAEIARLLRLSIAE